MVLNALMDTCKSVLLRDQKIFLYHFLLTPFMSSFDITWIQLQEKISCNVSDINTEQFTS